MSTTTSRELSLTELPGPGGWPLVGNLPQLWPTLLHRRLEEWAGEFGSLYRVDMAGKPVVVVSDPDLIREVLRDRPSGFRRQSVIESIMDEMGSNGLFSLEGDAWRRRRKLAMPAFNAGHLRGFHPTLETITERLRRRWLSLPPTDIRADLTRYTVDVTAKLTFDYDINTIEQSGDVIQQHLELIFPTINRRMATPFPYWRYVKLPADRALDRALAAIRRDLDEVIARARQNLPESPTNFIEALLLAPDGNETFTDDELFAEALTILVAGQDTTSNAMAWLLYHLAGHPEVQQRIRDEVAEIPSALERQPYLEAVAAESMRLRPTTPLIGLETVRDTVLGGAAIPAGTWVIINVQHPGLQEENFSDPLTFDPDRWLRDGGGNHRPEASTPFGSGPRFCPGRGLALLEIKNVVSMVCRTFDVRLPAGAQPPKDRFHFATIPIGMRLDLIPRG
ncbi:cytochrome P450 [Nocardia transvalensis]|uniref:cytochrome P450 n=1 Tax=Nocardia transvalensis TaxID=37333 RepID=UPI001894306C|nr:cytochrome P450 [Nocardia transvalensis]MBF6330781.1 cytochrome P450 [Nocardia transvalensis]